MKNVIIIDLFRNMTPFFLEQFPDVNVSVLVVLTEKDKEKYENNHNISKIYTVYEIHHCGLADDFTYEDIELYRDVQLMAELYMGRSTVEYRDYHVRKLVYYNALSFWLRVFKKCKIDGVFNLQENTGGIIDNVPLAIAKKNNIQCFSIDFWLSGMAMIDLLKNEFIMRNDHIEDLSQVQVLIAQDMKFGTDESKTILLAKVRKELEENGLKCTIKKIKKSLSLRLYLFYLDHLYKIGGVLFDRLIFCLFHRQNYWDWAGNSEDVIGRTYYADLVKGWFLLKRTNRFQRKYGVVPKSTNSIYFSIHLEPECSISQRIAPMDSQLLAIEMLSKCVPKDWVIYVKEHPDQINSNKLVGFGEFCESNRIFKNMDFYEALQKMPNVKIVKPNYNAKQMLSLCKAVAVFSGSVVLESMDCNKPLLLFQNERSIYKHFNGVFDIRSVKDCKEAIEVIANGYIPNYDNHQDIIAKMIFGYDEKEELMQSIKHYMRAQESGE